MITTLHTIDIRNIDNDMAHIFEHVFIVGFRNFLTKNGVNKDLFGWLDGEVFDKVMFINGGFYSESTAILLDEYIKNQYLYNDDEINHAIKVIQNENKAKITYDIVDVKDEINKLSQTVWNKVDSINDGTIPIISGLIKQGTDDKKDFKDITITVYGDNLSLTEQKLMLRIRVILIDIIDNYLHDNYHAYAMGSSQLYIKDDTSSYMQVCIINNNLFIKQIQNDCYNAIKLFNVGNNYSDIRQHLKVFANESIWQSMPINYCRYSGIITTNQEIFKLATKNNIVKLFAKLKVDVGKTKKSDWQFIS